MKLSVHYRQTILYRLGLVLNLFLFVLVAFSCSAGNSQLSEIAGSTDIHLGLLSDETVEGFARVIEPREFVFPADHGFHPEFLSEWLYFTGLLNGGGGEIYGYQLTFFRFSLGNQMGVPFHYDSTAFGRSGILMGHFALTDVSADSFYSYERFSREGAGIGGMKSDHGLHIWLDNWTAINQPNGIWKLFADAGEGSDAISINLELQTDSPPLLHGNHGLSRKGPKEGQANHYYSLVHLNTVGSISSRGQAMAVEGTSWMDHEWGSSALAPNSTGWDWFGLQLEDGSVLMAARIRLRGGGSEPNFMSTLLTKEGITHHLDHAQVNFKTNSHWQSPRTRIVYPASWTLSIRDFDLECLVNPLVSEQEFIGSTIYWEGAVTTDCLLAGSPLQGYGYTELTGYGKSENS